MNPQVAAPAIDPSLPPSWRSSTSTPPLVTGEVWGNWKPPKVVDFALQIAATNFVFRDQPFTSLAAHLAKTNLLLTATDVRLDHDSGHLEAPWVQYDIEHRVVALTNTRSHLDPLRIAACIGTNLVATLEPYHFASPPTLAVNGQVQTDAILDSSDLTFAVRGGPLPLLAFQQCPARGHRTLDRPSSHGHQHPGRVLRRPPLRGVPARPPAKRRSPVPVPGTRHRL
ncbi:MAG: hypothetical protein M5U12_06105 [Verrucomicrobia bacterium]|nr:hypothetical protein [Verrucomicrobiota bacterium]